LTDDGASGGGRLFLFELIAEGRERRTANIDALLRQLGWVVVKQKVNFEARRNGNH
jgi:hypothetical protein